jgi:dTDP-4-amino-4,6-dideoxygalactose transaminase
MTPSKAQPILSANPGAGYQRLKAELDAAVARVLQSGWYILGRENEAFEQEFAHYLGAAHALGVANGTDAVELALRAAGIGPGDLVVTVAHTAVATVAAIERIGARPYLVDISPATYTLNPAALQGAVAGPAKGARAVVPVHLYGHPADMDAILKIAHENKLTVVEDCAQAHGAFYRGRRTGTIGQLSAFSFYPTKNLGALGDGGAVATHDPALAERVRLLRQYGWRERYVSEIPGLNSRLDEMQAAILRVKLAHLDAANARRRQIAAHYSQGLAGLPLRLPTTAAGCEHVFHQYTIETDQRDALQQTLHKAGIGSAVLYPVPIHLQPAYRGRLQGADRLPCTEAAAGRILSLPMYPELEDEQIASVCRTIRSLVA